MEIFWVFWFCAFRFGRSKFGRFETEVSSGSELYHWLIEFVTWSVELFELLVVFFELSVDISGNGSDSVTESERESG
jgi:hypothetical protein